MNYTKTQVNQLAYEVVGCAIEVHKQVGPGLLESVYETCLCHELRTKGYQIERQMLVPIHYKGLYLEAELRLDVLVNDLIVVEIKAVEKMIPYYDAQILSYMKLLEKPKGLLINFHTDNISKSIKPFVNQYFSRLED